MRVRCLRAARAHARQEQSGRAVAADVYGARTQIQLGAALAAAFLAGEWDEEAMARRARQAVTPAPPWIRPITVTVLAGYHRAPADRPRELARYIRVAIADLDGAPTARAPRVARWFVSQQ